MRNVTCYGLAVIGMLAANTAFATTPSTPSGVGYGGDATAVGVGGSANSKSTATGVGVGIASSASKSNSNSTAVSSNYNANRNSLSTKQLNEQALSANTSSSSGGNTMTNQGDDIPIGASISYVDSWFNLPVANIGEGVVVTSWSFGLLGPLFKMGDQHVHQTPIGMTTLITLANISLTGTPDGTTPTGDIPITPTVAMVSAHAAICAHDPEFADQLAVSTTGFAACN